MKRHILFVYDDNDGPRVRSYVDDTAAIGDWMNEVFGDDEGFENWLEALRQHGHIAHSQVSKAEPRVVAIVTREIY